MLGPLAELYSALQGEPPMDFTPVISAPNSFFCKGPTCAPSRTGISMSKFVPSTATVRQVSNYSPIPESSMASAQKL